MNALLQADRTDRCRLGVDSAVRYHREGILPSLSLGTDPLLITVKSPLDALLFTAGHNLIDQTMIAIEHYADNR